MRTPLLLLAAGALATTVSVAPSAAAQDIFDRLQREPVTVLDAGIKRLRAGALLAARRLHLRAAAKPRVTVAFDRATRRIDLRFAVRARGASPSLAGCHEYRVLAIKETFQTDAMNLGVPVSEEKKVALRLGRMFTLEPAETPNAVQAAGERLVQSVFLEMTLTATDGATPILCEGPVGDLRGRP